PRLGYPIRSLSRALRKEARLRILERNAVARFPAGAATALLKLDSYRGRERQRGQRHILALRLDLGVAGTTCLEEGARQPIGNAGLVTELETDRTERLPTGLGAAHAAGCQPRAHFQASVVVEADYVVGGRIRTTEVAYPNCSAAHPFPGDLVRRG